MDFLPLDRSGNRRFLPIMVHPENAEINFSKSMRYNPMAYIHSEKDVLKLVTALMTNTKKVRAATHSGTKRNGFCSFR